MSNTILLADDSLTIQKVVELTFADTGYEVVAVSTGEELLTQLPELRPDIVICDVIMPGRDGYDVCQTIKSDPNHLHIPVILLTGTFEPFDRDRAVAAGCSEIITKPFEARKLVETVENLLEDAAPPQETDHHEGAIQPPPGDQPPVEPAVAGFQPMEPAPADADEDFEFGTQLAPPDMPEQAPVSPPVEPSPSAEIEADESPDDEDTTPAEAAPPDWETADDEGWQAADETEAVEWEADEATDPGVGSEPTDDELPPPPNEPFTGSAQKDDPSDGFTEADEAADQPFVEEDVPTPSDEVSMADTAPVIESPEVTKKTEREEEPEPEAAEPPAEPMEHEPAPEPEPEPVPEPEIEPEPVPEPGMQGDEIPEPPPAVAEEPVEVEEPPTVEEAPPAAEAPGAPALLSDDDIDRIAQRVLELAAGRIEQIAWDVVPDMAELVVRERIRELETDVEQK